MKSRRVLVALGLVLICGLTASRADAARPNVVLVITDDQGYGDLGCTGNPVLKTPNIDKLFGESIRLKDYHVSPTCSPTRSALQTGHWTNRTGVWHTIMGRSLLRENEVTIGQVFKDNGYATGMFGKWHLGDNYPYRPEDRGYTEVFRHGGGGVGQTPDVWDNAYFDGAYFHNGEVEPVKGFCTDVFFDHAKSFIKSQKAAGKPFFAYISTNAPHGPMHSPPEYSKPYMNVGSSKNGKRTKGNNVGLANFYGMIANIDDNVGQLRAMLDEEGLAENTIFIFTTDNGTSSGKNVFNAEMRGGKGSEYDGGHRVPFFMHWPAGDMVTGRDVEPITAHVDVLPTMIDMCKLDAPAGVKFDGKSIVNLLDGSAKETDGWNDRMLVTDSQRVKDPIKWRKSSVMSSQYRLINGKELYDIKQDPGQAKNIASEKPDVAKRMTDFYEAWWADLLPSFKNDAVIYLGHPGENPARLTSHDWITTGLTPWNHSHIREAFNGKENTGYWFVKVHASGTYEFRLRRWSDLVDAAITDGLPAGADVPGQQAFRARPGKSIAVTKAKISVAGESAEKAIPEGAQEVIFKLDLKEGKTRLTTTFETDKGEVYGAYYVYVRKL